MRLENKRFSVHFTKEGRPDRLFVKGDASGMNWLIDGDYLHERGYRDEDKLTGLFSAAVGGQAFGNEGMNPELLLDESKLEATFRFSSFQVGYTYVLADNGDFVWDIQLRNTSQETLEVERFSVWLSLAYVMFKDTDVSRNMEHSCAIFPSLSDDFSKLAAVKRDNRGPNLGIYATRGRTASVGSFCRYTNDFLLQVSPSLDGVIYHSLELIDSTANERADNWIYAGLGSNGTIEQGQTLHWQYVFRPFTTDVEFKQQAVELGHPIVDYSPVLTAGGTFTARVDLPENRQLKSAWIDQSTAEGIVRTEVGGQWPCDAAGRLQLQLVMAKPGECKLGLELDNGQIDFAVFNVLEPVRTIIEERVKYLCEDAFNQEATAFEPQSNQGESLGKLCLVLTKNLIAAADLAQIRIAEQSAVQYVKPKWFANGDFTKPVKLYGGFYRIFDFDYIGHIFYLLSRFKESELALHSPRTYLQWAAEIMIMRFSEEMHDDDREKKETKLTGVFTLYIQDLIDALHAEEAMVEQYDRLSALWTAFGQHLKQESPQYKGVVTEHYYDNAGFGPTCEALCLSGHLREASQYGELILANIGRSNDYRAQNPDRWWEALAYMLHSLWGGLVSNSARVAYEHLHDPEYLKAAYRSMMPLFYCYDWHAVSTKTRLARGEAASTYCVTSPNWNKLSLSHNRFGQSAFLEDGAVFANATGDDWDMGEELVAYLNGFGTKTYLYYEGDEIKCMNGHVEKQEDRYVITSYAAYPREYYFYEEQLSFKTEGRDEAPRVVLQNNQFRVESFLVLNEG